MNLLPHQRESADEFVRRGGRMLLWADTGTGKTATAIECAKLVGAKRVLYLAPSILKAQIKKEVDAWWPESNTLVVSGAKGTRKYIWNSGRSFLISNYEQLLHDEKEVLAYNPDFVIVDECQRFAAPTSKTLKIFRKLNPRYRLAMSGTPAPNHLHEFWNMTDWVSPGHFHNSFWQFRARECMMNPNFPAIIGYFDKMRMQKKFMSQIHRVRREDVLQLPPLTEVRIECELSKDQREVYEKLKEELVLELGNGQLLTVPNMLALIMRLRQMAGMPRVLGVAVDSAKQKKLAELLGAISSRKTIVFTEFSSVARALSAEYAAEALMVTGDTPQKDRDAIFERFRTDKDVRLLFLTSAAKYGVNLQAADTVIHYDSPWNEAGMDQRNARAWRYGQEKEVTSYRLVALKTVDEKMEKMVAGKKKATVEDLRKFFE